MIPSIQIHVPHGRSGSVHLVGFIRVKLLEEKKKLSYEDALQFFHLFQKIILYFQKKL